MTLNNLKRSMDYVRGKANNFMNSERHLLLGLLAFQNGFVTQAQLLVAFGSWVSDKSRELSDYLTEQKALSIEVVTALERMIDLHLVRFGGEPEKSLASLSFTGSSLRAELEQIAKGDNQALHTVSFLSPISKDKSPPKQDEFRTVEVVHSRPSGDERARSPGTDSQRFRIVHEHAKGGLGVVFVAEDQQLHREVAVKQIRQDRADLEEYRFKFEQEAQITGQLEHPGIVPIYALGTNEIGQPYYAMRFIRGEDLQSRIMKFHSDRKEQRLPFDGPELRALLRRFVDVCNAIDYAHDRGVLHRDLKPGNVMLGKHGETLVVDWGLAKAMYAKQEVDPFATMGTMSELPISKADSGTGSETRYGQFIGTPSYAPPEQMLGQLDRLGPASDVYSLGAILYELLTGKVPVSGKTLEELIQKSTTGEYPSPRKLASEIPRPLDAICQKAMSVKIDDRFPSAKLLREEVERWLNDEPVVTYSESIFERGSRLSKRHKSATLVGAIGLGLLSLFLACGIWISQRQAEALRLESAKTSLEAAKNSLEVAKTSMQLARTYQDAGNPFDAAKEIKRAIEFSVADKSAMAGKEVLLFDRLTQGGRSQCPPILTYSELIEFSPNGEILATSGATTRFWDVASGLPLGAPIHVGNARKSTFSRDGSIFAVATDKKLSFYNVKDGVLRGEYVHEHLVDDFVFCADGKRVVTVAGDSICEIEFNSDVALQKQTRFESKVPGLVEPDWPDWLIQKLFQSRLNSTGDVLTTKAPDGSVRVWRVATGMRIGSPILQFANGTITTSFNNFKWSEVLVDVDFSPSGDYFLTKSDWPIVWKSHSGNESSTPYMQRQTIPLSHGIGGVKQSVIGPDDRFVLTTGTSSLFVWKLPNWELHSEIGKKLFDIQDAAFSPDGKFLAVAHHKNCSIWDVSTGQSCGPPILHETAVKQLKYSPTGAHLATICDDRSIQVWKTSTETAYPHEVIAEKNKGYLENQFEFQSFLQIPNSNGVATLIGLGTGGTMGVGLEDSDVPPRYSTKVEIWDRRNKTPNKLLYGHEATLGKNSIQYDDKIPVMKCSPDGKLLAIGINGEGVKILDAFTGELVCGPLFEVESDRKKITSIVFHPDSKKIVVVTSDQTVKVWDDLTGKPVASGFKAPNLPGSGQVNYWVEYSQDGRLIAIASMQGVQFYDGATYQLVGKPLMHGDEMERFLFSPDGIRVVTYGTGVARFWDSKTGESLGVVLKHPGIKSVSFDHQGVRIATVGNNKIQIWESRSGERLGMELRADGVKGISFEYEGSGFLANFGDRIEAWEFVDGALPSSKEHWIALYGGASATTKLKREETKHESESAYARLRSDSEWLESRREELKSAVQRDTRTLALDAEKKHQWFAALVHLKSLSKWFPNESDVNDRINAATKYLPEWVTDATALTAETEKDWNTAIQLLESLSRKFTEDESIAKRLKIARTQRALSEIPRCVSESNFTRVVEIRRDSFRSSVNEKNEGDFNEMLLYASSLVALGTSKSVAEANGLLLYNTGPYDKRWRITTATCISKTPKESCSDSLSLFDKLSEEVQSKNQWVKGWILAQGGRHEEALPLLLDRTDFASRYFRTVAYKFGDQIEQARIQQRLAMLEFDKEWSREVNDPKSEWESKHAATAILRQLESLFPEDIDSWKIDRDAAIWEKLFEWKAALPLLEKLGKSYPTDSSIQERITSAKKNLRNE